jgi:hypothetical protein
MQNVLKTIKNQKAMHLNKEKTFFIVFNLALFYLLNIIPYMLFDNNNNNIFYLLFPVFTLLSVVVFFIIVIKAATLMFNRSLSFESIAVFSFFLFSGLILFLYNPNIPYGEDVAFLTLEWEYQSGYHLLKYFSIQNNIYLICTYIVFQEVCIVFLWVIVKRRIISTKLPDKIVR